MKVVKIIEKTIDCILLLLAIAVFVIPLFGLDNKDLTKISIIGLGLKIIYNLSIEFKPIKIWIKRKSIANSKHKLQLYILIYDNNFQFNNHTLKLFDRNSFKYSNFDELGNGKYKIKITESIVKKNDESKVFYVVIDETNEIMNIRLDSTIDDKLKYIGKNIDAITPIVDHIMSVFNRKNNRMKMGLDVTFKAKENPFLNDYYLSNLINIDDVDNLNFQIGNINVYKDKITVFGETNSLSSLKKELLTGILKF